MARMFNQLRFTLLFCFTLLSSLFYDLEAQSLYPKDEFYCQTCLENGVRKVTGEETNFYDKKGRLRGILIDAVDYLDTTAIYYSRGRLMPDSSTRFLAYYDVVKQDPALSISRVHYKYDAAGLITSIREFSPTDSFYKEIQFFNGKFGPDSSKLFYAADSFPFGDQNPRGPMIQSSYSVYSYDSLGRLKSELTCNPGDNFCSLVTFKYNASGQMIEKKNKRGTMGNLVFTQNVTLTKYDYDKKGRKNYVETRHSGGDPMASFFTSYKTIYTKKGLIKKTITVYNADSEKARYKYYFYK